MEAWGKNQELLTWKKSGAGVAKKLSGSPALQKSSKKLAEKEINLYKVSIPARTAGEDRGTPRLRNPVEAVLVVVLVVEAVLAKVKVVAGLTLEPGK